MARAPRPTEINLHQVSRQLDIAFDDGRTFTLPVEYLRVFSPSAEVRGHGPGQEVLQTGKSQVNISAIEPVGMYAVKLVFSDGHDTGIYSWDYLYDLGAKQDSNWKSYLEKLPNDPWGHPYQYANPGVKGDIDVYSFGADGRAGGEGRDADIGSWQ